MKAKLVIIGTIIVLALIVLAAPPGPKVLTGHVTLPGSLTNFTLPANFSILETSYTPVDSPNNVAAWVPGDVPNACQGNPSIGFESTPCHMMFEQPKILWKVYRNCSSGETVLNPAQCYCKKVVGRNRCQ